MVCPGYTRGGRGRPIPRTRNARTRAYISTVSHSLSSGKFIRANIRDAVKVTLFNVHPLRETSVHTHTHARIVHLARRPTERTRSRRSLLNHDTLFNSLEKRRVQPSFPPPPPPPHAPSTSPLHTFPIWPSRLNVGRRPRNRGIDGERNRFGSNRRRSKKAEPRKTREKEGKDERIETKVRGSNSRGGLLRRVVPREERPRHPIAVRINAIIRGALERGCA